MSSHRAARFHLALAIAAAILVALSAPAEARAPRSLAFEVVQDLGPYSFPTLTVGGDGNVYGTASTGTVFRIDGGVFTTVHTPTEGPPARLVVGPDGLLYGFTMQQPYSSGPFADHGVFFRLDYDRNYTVLLTLPRNLATDLVVGSDGAFYAGTAYESWAESSWNDWGMIKITAAGAYTFLGGQQTLLSPVPQVVGSDGALYGMRELQDGNNTSASFFRLDAAGTFNTIHEMTAAESFLAHLTLGSDGLLYATSQYGGNTFGGLFRMDNMGVVTLWRPFASSEGAYPTGSLTVGGDGAIYGVAEYGGNGWTGAGTVYRLDTDGTFTSLHSFNWTDGGNPNHGLVLARDGALYGVTTAGSPNPAAFRVDPSGTVTTYPVIPSNLMPSSPLVQGPNSSGFYGIAYYWDFELSNYRAIVYRLYEPRGCGIGFELAFVLPSLMWLRRRRRA